MLTMRFNSIVRMAGQSLTGTRLETGATGITISIMDHAMGAEASEEQNSPNLRNRFINVINLLLAVRVL